MAASLYSDRSDIGKPGRKEETPKYKPSGTSSIEPFKEAEGQQFYEAERSHKQEKNTEGSSGFCGDRGLGTVAVSEDGWGQKPVWSRWRNGWEARKSSL